MGKSGKKLAVLQNLIAVQRREKASVLKTRRTNYLTTGQNCRLMYFRFHDSFVQLGYVKKKTLFLKKLKKSRIKLYGGTVITS